MSMPVACKIILDDIGCKRKDLFQPQFQVKALERGRNRVL
jgi:hypothetical protein